MKLLFKAMLARLFNPLGLFAAGEQGVWYDPSDLTTLFQDSAGTTPVTAVEQPVGKMLDKSGRGNHATQATAGNRPTLSARVNQFIQTESFNNVAWAGNGVAVKGALDPLGGSNACTLTSNGSITNYQSVVANSTSQTITIRAKQGSGPTDANYYQVHNITTATGLLRFTVNYSTLAVTYITGSSGVTVTADSNGFIKITMVVSSGITVGNTLFVYMGFLGLATSGQSVILFGADFRATNDGVNLPPYQRVVTGTTADYDTTGFPLYLKFNGTSTSLATGSINFTSTAQMTVWAGVRKLSDAAIGLITELSPSLSANNGTFVLDAPDGIGLANYGFGSKGTTGQWPTASGFASPVTTILTGQANISAPSVALRANGTQVATNNSSQGTGNYGNYPLYIGARNGSTWFFNGRLYSLIVRGAASTGTQITATETWVNGKTSAY